MKFASESATFYGSISIDNKIEKFVSSPQEPITEQRTSSTVCEVDDVLSVAVALPSAGFKNSTRTTTTTIITTPTTTPTIVQIAQSGRVLVVVVFVGVVVTVSGVVVLDAVSAKASFDLVEVFYGANPIWLPTMSKVT